MAPVRNRGAKAAVILVHGFTGGPDSWTNFVNLLLADSTVADWDVFRIGYSTGLRIDIPHVWEADPDLAICAKELRTALGVAPLGQYEGIALVAHSMGGLVVQRAILDDPALQGRLAHVMLFGTPSGGLRKARLTRVFKRQLRDMGRESDFISDLRTRWKKKVGEKPNFTFLAVAGDRDACVEPESSIKPFPDHQVAVIPGNHFQIVAPEGQDHAGYKLVVDMLADRGRPGGPVQGALLAVERGQHQKAVDVLLPRAAELDDAALESLALSLDSLGRGTEALELLEQHLDKRQPTSNLLGILGGRLKRRWLLERTVGDLERATALYSRGLAIAEEQRNAAQAYYHAINLAFLELMRVHSDAGVPDAAKQCALQARVHCGGAVANEWREATLGEAALVLEDLDLALTYYAEAVRRTASVRSRDSMYTQAVIVAGRVFGADGVKEIERVFCLA